LAVDDIHIFDKTTTVFSPSAATSINSNYLGNTWTNFSTGGATSAAMGPGVHSFGNVEVLVYPHDTLYNTGATQATIPHSYNTTPAGGLTDTATWRLFLTDAEFLQMLNDTACPSCSRAADAYRLGITHYANTNNPALQNGSLSDDTGGAFQFIPYASVVWVPFDNGYYGQFAGGADGEFWFNDGGPTGNIPLGIDYLDFEAFKNDTQINLAWYSLIDTAVAQYFVEKSTDGINFTTLLDTAAAGLAPSASYVTTDAAGFGTNAKLYYRLNFTLKNGNAGVSPIRTVNNIDSAAMLVNFNAERVNHTTVALDWSSTIDAQFQDYLVERQLPGGTFQAIGGVQTSARQNDFAYHRTDQPDPTGTLPDGAVVNYRVTGILANGVLVVFPVKSVVWSQNNALVNVYPNPVHDGNLTVVYECDPGTAVEVQISDAVGRQIYGTQLTAGQWHNTTTLYTFAHPAGIYVVKVTIGGKTYIRKMEWL
jgi:Secretion system C-terminal sorting domain